VKKGIIILFFWSLCGLVKCVAEDIPLQGNLPSPKVTSVSVVVVEDRKAVRAFEPQFSLVQTLVDRGICKMTGKDTISNAWKTLVTTQDVIGIKVLSSPGLSGTRPAVAEAVVTSLINSGIPTSNIIIWDKHIADLRSAGFVDVANRHQVRVQGSAEMGYDEKVYYDNSILGTLVWGDLEFGRPDTKKGRKSYFSKMLTSQVTKIINIAPLLNHNVAGINGCLCSLALGSVDNTMRFELQDDRMARAIPEIYAQPPLVDHTVLNIMDALLAQYQGEQTSLLQYAVPLGQIWFSKDPVALDVLGMAELDRQRQVVGLPPSKANPELYQNATLMELGVSEIRKIQINQVK